MKKNKQKNPKKQRKQKQKQKTKQLKKNKIRACGVLVCQYVVVFCS